MAGQEAAFARNSSDAANVGAVIVVVVVVRRRIHKDIGRGRGRGIVGRR